MLFFKISIITLPQLPNRATLHDEYSDSRIKWLHIITFHLADFLYRNCRFFTNKEPLHLELLIRWIPKDGIYSRPEKSIKLIIIIIVYFRFVYKFLVSIIYIFLFLYRKTACPRTLQLYSSRIGKPWKSEQNRWVQQTMVQCSWFLMFYFNSNKILGWFCNYNASVLHGHTWISDTIIRVYFLFFIFFFKKV